MQFIIHLFAENVWPLIWLIALAELVLLIAMVGTGRGRLLVWMGVLAALAVLLLLLEWLLVTDRERVDGIVNQMAKAVRNGDIDGLLNHLAPQCHFGDMNREGVRQLASSVIHEFEIDRVTVGDRKTQVFPHRKQATAEFLAVVRGKQAKVEFAPYASRWILTFHQDPAGQWQVVEIERLQAFGENRQPVPPPGRLGL
ncbi:MAG: hypothetical protein HY000_05250 [Planctomycetes bacterium]|nr:hypothetical protein [Planctomycetota bacterium]